MNIFRFLSANGLQDDYLWIKQKKINAEIQVLKSDQLSQDQILNQIDSLIAKENSLIEHLQKIGKVQPFKNQHS